MQHTFATVFLSIVLMLPAASAADKTGRWHAAWRVSQMLLAGADAADTSSSWGKNEANPLVRTGQRFSYGSLAIKVGALAGGLGAQRYIQRKAPDSTRLFAVANLAGAALLSATAARNMQVPSTK